MFSTFRVYDRTLMLKNSCKVSPIRSRVIKSYKKFLFQSHCVDLFITHRSAVKVSCPELPSIQIIYNIALYRISLSMYDVLTVGGA